MRSSAKRFHPSTYLYCLYSHLSGLPRNGCTFNLKISLILGEQCESATGCPMRLVDGSAAARSGRQPADLLTVRAAESGVSFRIPHETHLFRVVNYRFI